MAKAEEYAQWIVDNADKKGTPEFDTVAKAYQAAKSTSYRPNSVGLKEFGQASASLADQVFGAPAALLGAGTYAAARPFTTPERATEISQSVQPEWATNPVGTLTGTTNTPGYKNEITRRATEGLSEYAISPTAKYLESVGGPARQDTENMMNTLLMSAGPKAAKIAAVVPKTIARADLAATGAIANAAGQVKSGTLSAFRSDSPIHSAIVPEDIMKIATERPVTNEFITPNPAEPHIVQPNWEPAQYGKPAINPAQELMVRMGDKEVPFTNERLAAGVENAVRDYRFPFRGGVTGGITKLADIAGFFPGLGVPFQGSAIKALLPIAQKYTNPMRAEKTATGGVDFVTKSGRRLGTTEGEVPTINSPDMMSQLQEALGQSVMPVAPTPVSIADRIVQYRTAQPNLSKESIESSLIQVRKSEIMAEAKAAGTPLSPKAANELAAAEVRKEYGALEQRERVARVEESNRIAEEKRAAEEQARIAYENSPEGIAKKEQARLAEEQAAQKAAEAEQSRLAYENSPEGIAKKAAEAEQARLASERSKKLLDKIRSKKGLPTETAVEPVPVTTPKPAVTETAVEPTPLQKINKELQDARVQETKNIFENMEKNRTGFGEQIGINEQMAGVRNTGREKTAIDNYARQQLGEKYQYFEPVLDLNPSMKATDVVDYIKNAKPDEVYQYLVDNGIQPKVERKLEPKNKSVSGKELDDLIKYHKNTISTRESLLQKLKSESMLLGDDVAKIKEMYSENVYPLYYKKGEINIPGIIDLINRDIKTSNQALEHITNKGKK
jgi:hypothetical protein